MKVKLNFKKGILVGSIIGIMLVGYGYYTFQNMIEKSENISNFDLHQLHYEDLEGNEVHLSDYKGKNVFVNFWATWCAPCVKEFPVLNEVYSNVKDDFVFVVVSYESRDKIEAFAKDKPYQFIYLKSNNFILEGITTVPQTFILDTQGNNVYHHPTIFEGSVEEIVKMLYEWVK